VQGRGRARAVGNARIGRPRRRANVGD
jgi:hypothetical protein